MKFSEDQKKEAPADTGTSASPPLQLVDTFLFEGSPVRTERQDGVLWWCLADVCKAIGISNPSDAASRLEDEDKKVVGVGETEGGSLGSGWKVYPTFINEAGLWTLVLRSNKPEAKRFKRWVVKDIIPSIIRTGTYSVPRNEDTRPGQQLLALPSPTNPRIDFSVAMDLMVQAAKAAREIKPRHREHWIRLTAIGAYRSIYGADISDFLPQPIALFGEAGLTQGSLTGKVAVVNGDTRTTATPSLPEPPPLPSLTEKDVIKARKLEWWSMLKLEHVTGLDQLEILCCLYDGGATIYYQKDDSLIPNVNFKNCWWLCRNGQFYWIPSIVALIDGKRGYLETEWPIKWITRQRNRMIVEGGAK